MDIKGFYLSAIDVYKQHSKQRMDTFNFFIVTSGLLVNAYVMCFNSGLANKTVMGFAAALSVFETGIAFLFFFSDIRVANAIRTAHNLLSDYEKCVDFKNGITDKSIGTLFNSISKTTRGKYIFNNGIRLTIVLRSVYLIFFLFGLGALITSIVFIA